MTGHDNQPLFRLRVPDIPSFLATLEQVQITQGWEKKEFVSVIYRENQNLENSEIADLFGKGLVTVAQLLLSGLLIYFVMKMGGGQKGSGGLGGINDIFSMMRGNFKVYGQGLKVETRFNDVAGLHEAKKEVMEFVDFLKKPETFKRLGAKIPRGALLVGPPGTGKTLLAKACAGEAGVPFFSCSGSDFVEMFVGVGASRVRTLFKQAKEKAPSIIFIDEIDAVARKRHGKMGSVDERDNTLNQLLVEMDGFGTDINVVILGGTNRKDILDQAILRPGRFDRQIELTLPDLKSREEILKVHLKPIKFNIKKGIEEYSHRLAALTPGFSGADLMNLCNEAAIIAARNNQKQVESADFESASERILGGLEASKKLTFKEKRTVAYHEAGHAVSAWFLEGADPVLKVSILPRSKGALGFAQVLPDETMLITKEEIMDKMCTALGGRCSEEHFFGKVTTGAQDDLMRVTKMARAIVRNYGMSEKLGLIGFDPREDEQYSKPYGEKTEKIIDQEVKSLVNLCTEKTRALIKEKKDLIEKLAQVLMEKERIVHEDLHNVLGKRPFANKEGYSRYLQIKKQDQIEKEQEQEQKIQEEKKNEGEGEAQAVEAEEIEVVQKKDIEK